MVRKIALAVNETAVVQRQCNETPLDASVYNRGCCRYTYPWVLISKIALHRPRLSSRPYVLVVEPCTWRTGHEPTVGYLRVLHLVVRYHGYYSYTFLGPKVSSATFIVTHEQVFGRGQTNVNKYPSQPPVRSLAITA